MTQRYIDGEWVTVTDLIQKHRLFIYKRIHRHRGTGRAAGMDMDDLFNVASMGIMKAFDQFDASRGFRFLTYATTKIDGEIMQEIKRNTRLIHIPSHMYDLMGKIQRHDLWEEPIEVIAEKTGSPVTWVRKALSTMPHTHSYNSTFSDEEGGAEKFFYLADETPPFNGWEYEFVDHLREDERTIVLHRLQGKTYQEAADLIGCSKQNIRYNLLRVQEKWEAYQNGNQCVAY